MQRQALEEKGKTSSFIKAVGHEEGLMEIEFHDGSVAQYEVPRDDYLRMMDAESIGKHFHKFIKYRKVKS